MLTRTLSVQRCILAILAKLDVSKMLKFSYFFNLRWKEMSKGITVRYMYLKEIANLHYKLWTIYEAIFVMIYLLHIKKVIH